MKWRVSVSTKLMAVTKVVDKDDYIHAMDALEDLIRELKIAQKDIVQLTVIEEDK